MSTLIAEARQALESDCTADRLETLHAQLKQHVTERTGRLKAVTAKDGSTWAGGPGTERQKVLATGNAEALCKLDDECKTVEAELEIARDLQGKLRKRFDETKAREDVDGMPGEFAELDDLLTAQAEVEAAARKARQATDAKLQDIRTQRHHITRQTALAGQRLELPAADPELLARYMKVQGYSYYRTPNRTGWFSPTSGPHDLKNVAETLGVNVPRPEQQAA